MINVVYEKTSYITSVNVSGHANYGKYGNDIVCASVSTCVIYAFNLAMEFDSNIAVKELENNLKISINSYSVSVETVLQLLITTLLELEEQYRDNIKVIRR